MDKISSDKLMTKIAAVAKDNELRAAYEAGVRNHAVCLGLDPKTADVVAKKASVQFCAKEEASMQRKEAFKKAILDSFLG